jgi:hypothetical protein
MRIKFFKIPVTYIESAEQALDSFIQSKAITLMERTFVADGENSFWAITVLYNDHLENSKAIKSKIDYREILSEKDFALFAELRELRKKTAEKNGVPVYAIFTNEQLAEMVRKRVKSLNELSAGYSGCIPGKKLLIYEKKLRLYPQLGCSGGNCLIFINYDLSLNPSPTREGLEYRVSSGIPKELPLSLVGEEGGRRRRGLKQKGNSNRQDSMKSRGYDRNGDERVQRGGSWDNNGRRCRSANRNRWNPERRDNNTGFRFAQIHLNGCSIDQIVILSAVRQKGSGLSMTLVRPGALKVH